MLKNRLNKKDTNGKPKSFKFSKQKNKRKFFAETIVGMFAVLLLTLVLGIANTGVAEAAQYKTKTFYMYNLGDTTYARIHAVRDRDGAQVDGWGNTGAGGSINLTNCGGGTWRVDMSGANVTSWTPYVIVQTYKSKYHPTGWSLGPNTGHGTSGYNGNEVHRFSDSFASDNSCMVYIGAGFGLQYISCNWEGNTHTITAYPNGGSLVGGNFGGHTGGASVTVQIGSQSYNHLGTAERAGYTFDGFWTDPNGGTQIFKPNGGCTNEGTYWSDYRWQYDGNLTVYAHWKTATQTNYISHWAWGFNGQGNNGDGSAFNFASTSFSQNTSSYFTLGSGNAVTVPKGFTLTQSFGTSSINGSWQNLPFGTGMTQKADSMYFEYDYSPIYYSISYNLNGGTNSSSNPSSYTILHGLYLKDPYREGYTFKGWYDNNGNRVTNINGGCNASFSSGSDMYNKLNSRTTGNITLNARWQVNTYSNGISHWATSFQNREGNNGDKSCFKLGETSYNKTYGSSVTINSNDAVRIPNGFRLVNHFGTNTINSNGTWKTYNMPYTFNQPAKSTWAEFYYAPKSYNITYDLDGGTNNSANPSTYNVLYGVALKNPTKKYWKFVGWKGETEVISNNQLDKFDTTISNGEYIFDNTTSGNRLNHAAIQIWNNAGSEYYQDLATITTVGKVATKYTHTRATGYYTVRIKANGNIQDSSVMYKDCYFEKGKTYDVSFECTKLTNNQVKVKDASITVSDYITGINKGKNASFTSADDLYNQLSTRQTGNIKLKAIWVEDTYNIAFDKNTGKGEDMPVQTIKYFHNTKLHKNTYTKCGFKFVGWNTKADGSGQSFEDEGTVYNLAPEVHQTITLYAQWELNIDLVIKSQKEFYHTNEVVTPNDIRTTVIVTVFDKTSHKDITEEFDNNITKKAVIQKITDENGVEQDKSANLNTSKENHYKVNYEITVSDKNITEKANCTQKITIVNDEIGAEQQENGNSDNSNNSGNAGTQQDSNYEENSYPIRYVSKKYVVDKDTLKQNSKWKNNATLNSELTSSLNKKATDENSLYVIKMSKKDCKEIKEYICNGKTWNKDLNNDVLSKFNKKTENNTTFLVGKNWKYDYK